MAPSPARRRTPHRPRNHRSARGGVRRQLSQACNSCGLIPPASHVRRTPRTEESFQVPTPCIARSAHRSRLPSWAQPLQRQGQARAYEPRMIRPAQETGRHQASRFKLRTRRHQASVQDHGRGFRLRHRLATAASVRCPCHTHVSKGRGFLPAGSSASPGTRTVRYTASPVGADEISKLSDAE